MSDETTQDPYNDDTSPGLPNAMDLVNQLQARVNQLETELAEARRAAERWMRFAEASIEGIVLHDGERVRDLNAQFAELFGYTRDEVLGQPLLDFVAPEERERVREILEKNRVEPYELNLIRKGGDIVRAHVRPRILKNGSRMATFRTLKLEEL